MNGIAASVIQAPFPSTISSQNSIAVFNSLEVNSVGDVRSLSRQLSEDYSLAAQPLAMNRFYILRNSEENYQIKAAIKRVLTAQDCDLNVKRKIFENIMNIEKNILDDMGKRGDQPADMHYLNAINELLEEIREAGGQIILDNTDFTGINIKNLDLTGASAVSAKFNSMQMRHVVWKNADLSYTHFNSSEIHSCYFEDVTVSMSAFNKCIFVGSVLSNVTIFKTRFYETNFDHVIAPCVKTDDVFLRRKIAQSVECDLTKNLKGFVFDDLNFQFYLRTRQFELDLARAKFAQILNFKHSCSESQNSTLNLRISRLVGEAVPELPGIVAEHISQYAYHDSLWAGNPPIFNRARK